MRIRILITLTTLSGSVLMTLAAIQYSQIVSEISGVRPSISTIHYASEVTTGKIVWEKGDQRNVGYSENLSH